MRTQEAGTRRQHVLVVDDWRHLCLVVRTGLEMLGDYRVSAACNRVQAVPLLDADRPDLVLLDAHLHGATGIDLAGEAIRRDIPVVLMTAGTATDKRLERAGWRYIRKPFRLDDLLAEVRRSIDRREKNVATTRALLARSSRIAAELRATIQRSAALRNSLRDTVERARRSTDRHKIR